MEYARYGVGLTVFLTTAVALGSLLSDDDDEKPTVELDPRSSDFLKIKIGETRIDPMSGFSQTIVLSARVLSGQRKTADSKIVDLRGPNTEYGRGGTAEVIGSFLRSKLAPIPGAAIDVLARENVVGQEVTPFSAAIGLFIPLSLGEVKDAMQARGVPAGTAISILALLGMSTGTYGPKTEYMAGMPEQRKEQFKKDLKTIEWDSPDPAYSEFLTKEQMEQVRTQRETNKQRLVIAATASDPKRNPGESEESYQERKEEKTAERNAALESLRELGWTAKEIKQLILDRYGPYWKLDADDKQAVKNRLLRINQEFSQN